MRRVFSSSLSVATRLLMAAFAAAAASAACAELPVPAGLQPGDKYHLVFNSSTVTTAFSQDITTYNGVVQAAANSAGIGDSEGVEWRAIASTPFTDARDNAAVGASTPVYNLRSAGMQRVATGFSDFWDGSISAPLSYSEQGAFVPRDAWTGSNTDGTKHATFMLGSNQGNAWCGSPTSLNSLWVQFVTPSLGLGLSVYGLSEELTAPPPESTLAGDYNADGVVDAADYTLWRDHLGSTDWRADGDADGVVTINDFLHWRVRFGNSVAGASQVAEAFAAPEAASLLTALAAILALAAVPRGARAARHSE